MSSKEIFKLIMGNEKERMITIVLFLASIFLVTISQISKNQVFIKIFAYLSLLDYLIIILLAVIRIIKYANERKKQDLGKY